MVRHGMPVISDMGQVATVEEGRYAHLTQDVDSMGGAQWMRLQAVEWRWPAESIRLRGRGLPAPLESPLSEVILLTEVPGNSVNGFI